jgi:hypothetical protein
MNTSLKLKPLVKALLKWLSTFTRMALSRATVSIILCQNSFRVLLTVTFCHHVIMISTIQVNV